MLCLKRILSLLFEFVILFLFILLILYILWNWDVTFTLGKFKLKQALKENNKEQLVNQLSESKFPDRIIIPKIGVNAEVLWNPNKENLLEELRNGVIHYPGSEFPGEKGNIILIGHSSGIPGSAGKYDNVFLLLSELKNGDFVTLYFKGNQFNYSVFNKKIIRSDFRDLKLDSFGNSNLVLVTCWPPGTNFKRLVVMARQI